MNVITMTNFREYFSVIRSALLGIAVAVSPPTFAKTIIVGQSAAVTGGQAAFTKDAQNGLLAYFSAVNRNGGVNGDQIELVTLDDEGKRDKTLANTKTLVNERSALALIGYTSGAGVEATLPYLIEAKTPMLAPLTGNMAIRAKFNRYLFHTRAGYDVEMEIVMKHLRASGNAKYAIVYLEDAKGNGDAMRAVLAKEKVVPVATLEINRNATDFSAAVGTILKAQPEAVIFITNGQPLAKIAQGLRKAGYFGQIISSSFAGTRFVEDIKQDAAGIVITQVLPPLSKQLNKVVREFQADIKNYAPEAKANLTGLEAYISARVLVEGLRRAGSGSTRERFVQALERSSMIDLGGYQVTFSERNRDGSRFVDTSVVARDGSIRY
jgi:branched-chain amino acid transport system substrate-binding protein